MKRNWELIDSIVKTIAESDKDIFGINDFKSAETSEKEIKYSETDAGQRACLR